MSVVTRFAPSPTGILHIGGARTALFNWLFARRHGGRFLLRVEDTDRARSTEAAVAAIFEGLSWLGLNWDGDAVRQSHNAARHAAVAQALLAAGAAYRCYCTPEELDAMRTRARAEGRTRLYDGACRDRDPADARPGVAPSLRLKVPLDGETTIDDAVQGPVTVSHDRLDDMVLLRSDGTPTYMLSAVVDDRDMAVTHVIRGDDHLTNAFRQHRLYAALGWKPPVFAHIPLIHGADGRKLSKRHGAIGVATWRDEGFLPAAMRNYLLRLGWSHGDDEIVGDEDAVAWFGLDGVGRAPARFDRGRLLSLNAAWIRSSADAALVEAIAGRLSRMLGRALDAGDRNRLEAAMPGLKPRADTLAALAENARFYVARPPLPMTSKAAASLDAGARRRLGALAARLATLEPWSEAGVESCLRAFAADEGVGFGKVARPLRAALTGSAVSPGIFEVVAVLGREAVIERLSLQAPATPSTEN